MVVQLLDDHVAHRRLPRRRPSGNPLREKKSSEKNLKQDRQNEERATCVREASAQGEGVWGPEERPTDDEGLPGGGRGGELHRRRRGSAVGVDRAIGVGGGCRGGPGRGRRGGGGWGGEAERLEAEAAEVGPHRRLHDVVDRLLRHRLPAPPADRDSGLIRGFGVPVCLWGSFFVWKGWMGRATG